MTAETNELRTGLAAELICGLELDEGFSRTSLRALSIHPVRSQPRPYAPGPAECSQLYTR